MAIMLMQKVISAMSTIQSDPSPIESAARSHSNLFTVYVIVLVVSGIVVAILTVLVWRASNRQQDAIQADALARIAEARNSAAKADERAAQADERAAAANVEAAKATESAAKLNERAQALERDNLLLRDDVNKATGEVAVLQKNAADARTAQQRVETELAKQQERAANAERSLLELQARIQPRRLIPEQSAKLLELLRDKPKGDIDVTCMNGDAESCALATQIVSVLRQANWTVDFADVITGSLNPAPFEGMALFIKNRQNLPPHGKALLLSLTDVGLPAIGIEDPSLREGKVLLTVGVKPLEQRQRTVTAEQRTLFLKLSQGFPKGKIRIIGLITDAEAMTFAAQLSSVLREAGWTIDDTKDGTATFGPVGLTFFSKVKRDMERFDSPLFHFAALTNILTEVGIDFSVKFNPNLAETEVRLFVGSSNPAPRFARGK